MPVRKCIPQIINGFKVIEDLGITTDLGWRTRTLLMECKKCKRPFKIAWANIRNQKVGCSKKCAFGVIASRRLQRLYSMIIERTEKKTHVSYDKYGALGIKLCDEWRKDSTVFYKWCLENGYSDSLTLDRIDNSKGYSPDNCRWTTKSVQSQNSRQAKLTIDMARKIKFDLKNEPAQKVADLFGVSKSLVYGIRSGLRWKNVY